MGICKSKPKPQVHLLNERQRGSILAMFTPGTDPNVQSVSQVTLRVIWCHVLTEYILALFIDHLFKSEDRLLLADLERFYYDMVEGPAENRTERIMSMLGTEDGIRPNDLQNYIVNLVESYINILRKVNPEAYYTWLTGDVVYRSDLNIVVDYCMKDISYSENGMVGRDDLERWLLMCSFAREVFESVIHHLCNMDVGELSPVLPKCDKYNTLLRMPMVLLLSHMTKYYTKRLWRQLYDSHTDAHSWVILQHSIIDEGPTLILIEEVGGVLFGGFASQSWKVRSGFYGDEKCFLFRLRPEVIKCTASGYNNHFQYLFDGTGMFPKGLAFGGFLNYFGIFLNPDFGPGRVSETCLTFNDYTPLSKNSKFYFSRIVVWGISHAETTGNALWLERRKKQVGLYTELDDE